ncbi:unnamed protein product, partial [Prorocentrum cordatum]
MPPATVGPLDTSWTCPSCGLLVFRRHSRCQQCGTDRHGAAAAAALPESAPLGVIPAWRAGAAASEADGAGAMAEAERRMAVNVQNKEGWAEIARLKSKHGLSDHVELALKLLEPARLAQLLGNNLGWRLAEVESKDALLRQMVAASDPAVERLLLRLDAEEQLQCSHWAPHVASAPLRAVAKARPQRRGSRSRSRAAGPRPPPGPPPSLAQAQWLTPRPPRGPPPGHMPAAPLQQRPPAMVPPAMVPQAVLDGHLTSAPPARAAQASGVATANGAAAPPWPRMAGPNQLVASGADAPPPAVGGAQPPVRLAALLAGVNLASFVAPLARLGVEGPSDLPYVTEEDLEGMGMSVIQRRKFRNLVDGASGTGSTDAASEEPGSVPTR